MTEVTRSSSTPTPRHNRPGKAVAMALASVGVMVGCGGGGGASEAQRAAQEVCDVLANAESFEELFAESVRIEAQYPDVDEEEAEKAMMAICPDVMAAWEDAGTVDVEQQEQELPSGVTYHFSEDGEDTIYTLLDGTHVKVSEGGVATVVDGEGKYMREATEGEKGQL